MGDSEDIQIDLSQYAQDPYQLQIEFDDSDLYKKVRNTISNPKPKKRTTKVNNKIIKRNLDRPPCFVINNEAGRGSKLIRIQIIYIRDGVPNQNGEDNNIDITCLEGMQDEELKILIPESKLRDRMKFKMGLRKYKDDMQTIASMSPISSQHLLEILTGNDQPTTTKPVQRNKDANQIVCIDSQRGAAANPSITHIAEKIDMTQQLRVVLERIPPKRLAQLRSGEPKAKCSKLTTTTTKRVDLMSASPDEDFPIAQNIHHQVQSPTSEPDDESASAATSPQTVSDTDVSDNEEHSVPERSFENADQYAFTMNNYKKPKEVEA
ncbi:uncharacterized protein LOC133525323 [Cydia pomonella]|uniref:uncharacterized protein LOC133525323 n=1 Tax=Cydia pomonella TaxID=82600 RepID=UPI002ADE7485|nr:uncharacterized protein LOC133525323 [Cydia pomonella]